MNKIRWKRLISLLLVLFVFVGALSALADDEVGGGDSGNVGGGNTGGDSGNTGDGGNTGGGDNTGGGNSGEGGSGGESTKAPSASPTPDAGQNPTTAPDPAPTSTTAQETSPTADPDDEPSATPVVTPTATVHPSATPTIAPSASPAVSPSPTAMTSPAPEVTASPSPSPEPTPEPTVPPMDILLERFLGDFSADEFGIEGGASPEDLQIVVDAMGNPVNYKLIPIPSEGALLVEVLDVGTAMQLRLRLSQVRRFVEELNIRTLYFRSGNVTLYVPMEGLLSGDPAKLVRLLSTTYADMAMEVIDFSGVNFASEPIPELTAQEMRDFSFEISVAPMESSIEINVALRVGEETVDMGFMTTDVQLCIHGQGSQICYSNLFGMEEPLNAARGNLPAANSEALEAFETHFDAATPWADIVRESLTEERVSGMVVNYPGYGNYSILP